MHISAISFNAKSFHGEIVSLSYDSGLTTQQQLIHISSLLLQTFNAPDSSVIWFIHQVPFALPTQGQTMDVFIREPLSIRLQFVVPTEPVQTLDFVHIHLFAPVSPSLLSRFIGYLYNFFEELDDFLPMNDGAFTEYHQELIDIIQRNFHPSMATVQMSSGTYQQLNAALESSDFRLQLLIHTPLVLHCRRQFGPVEREYDGTVQERAFDERDLRDTLLHHQFIYDPELDASPVASASE